MKLGKLVGLLVVAFLLVPVAKADGPVFMEFAGVNGANDGQYYVSPYYGVMNYGSANQQQVVLFCDDIINDINFGQTWWANVTNLGSAVNGGGFSNTRYGTVGASQLLTTPTVAYEEAAWLVTQFASHPNDLVNLQYALWDIMNPGARGNTNADVQNWLLLASENYNNPGLNLYDFEIVTNVGPLTLTGQEQEFIVMTPEPGTLAMLLCGLLVLSVRLFNRGRLAI